MLLNLLKSSMVVGSITLLSIVVATTLWFLSPGTLWFNVAFAVFVFVCISSFIYYVYYKHNRKKKSDIDDVILRKRKIKKINIALRWLIRYLKSSNYFSGDTFYQMPWYIMVGGVSSGKSTLLEKNKFDHVVPENRKYMANGLIDFWVGETAVVIELNKDIFSEYDFDSTLFNHLLKRLRLYRSRQLLNGIIGVVDSGFMLEKDVKEHKLYAGKLQNLITTANKRSNMQVPVYLIFSKVDVISDFAAFFNSYSSSDTNLPLGVTFPVDAKAFDKNYLIEKSQLLLSSMLDQQFTNIDKCTRPSDAESMIVFPYQFKLFLHEVTGFVEELNRLKRINQSLKFRGFYLLSSEQGRNKSDIVSKVTSQSMQFHVRKENFSTLSSRSLFCTHVFEKVIIPESAIAGVSTFHNRLFLFFQTASIIVSIVIIVAVARQFIDNWGDDEKFRDFAVVKIQSYNRSINNLNEFNASLDKLIVLLQELRKAAYHESYNYPWYRQISARQAYNAGKIREIYIDQLHMLLLPRLTKLVENELKFKLKADNVNHTFQLLYFYNILIGAYKKHDNQMISDYFLETLNSRQRLKAGTMQSLKILVHDLLNSDYESSLTIDKDLINRATNRIREIDPAKLLYNIIRSMPEHRNLVDARKILGSEFSRLFEFDSDYVSYMIPEIFTLKGYEKIEFNVNSTLLTDVLKQYKLIAGIENNTSDDTAMVERVEYAREIQEIYYENYIKTWKDLVKVVKVRDFNSIEQLGETVRITAGSSSPLKQLLDAIVVNTSLPVQSVDEETGQKSSTSGLKTANRLARKVKVPKALNVVKKEVTRGLKKGSKKGSNYEPDQVLGSQPSSVVNNAFLEYSSFFSAEGDQSISGVLAQMNNLTRYLDASLTSPIPEEMWYGYAVERANGSQTVLAQLRSEADKAPPVIARAIESLLSETWSKIMLEANQFIDRIWKDQVISFYKEAIAGRFPFDPQGRGEVVLADFVEFFKPQGRLDQFIQQYLSPFIQFRYNRLEKKIIDGQRLNITDSLMSQLRKAQLIRRQFFGPAGQVLAVKLKLRAVSMNPNATMFQLKSNKVMFSYRHGPRIWEVISWPDQEMGSRISALFYKNSRQLDNRIYSGEWALFRLLLSKGADDKGMSSRKRMISIDLNQSNINLEVENEGGGDIIGARAFTTFSLPGSLLSK